MSRLAVQTLPISTAACERGFSQMNIVCSDLRSSLTVAHMSFLMFIGIVGPQYINGTHSRMLSRGWPLGDVMQRQQTVGPESPMQVMQISLIMPLSQHGSCLTRLML